MKNSNWFHFVLFAVTGLLLFCCVCVPANAAEDTSKSYNYSLHYKFYRNAGASGYYCEVSGHGDFGERIACYVYPETVTVNTTAGTEEICNVISLFCSSTDTYNTVSLSADINSHVYDKDGKLLFEGSDVWLLDVYGVNYSSPQKITYFYLDTDIPAFSSMDAVRNYLETGDTSNQINKDNYEKLTDDKPLFDDFAELDFSDTDTNYLRDFRLEGFKSDYFVNASWSSVHIPNKLQQWMDKGTIDMDDVAVMVMFTYANKNFPETDKYTKYYPRLLSAADLAATINVADFAPVNDMYYLSSLSFIPVVEFTYYNFGMGTSMKPLNLMYYGSMNHIYFKQDGSANGAAFDAGDINGDKDGGFGLGDDDYNGIGGITGDITDALSKFSELLDSLYGSLSRVAKFATVVFSWLPWWASLLIGAAVAVCFILRIAGR